jgi:uncharacterized repeat protein (TIGR01451 family)
VCEVLNPANCDIADVVITVSAAPIVADADLVSGINGLNGALSVLDVLPGDTLNGAPVLLGATGNASMTVLTPAVPVVAGATVPGLDIGTGKVSVPANTPAGTYQITYQICEKLNPLNCATAIATVEVVGAPIIAADDAPPVVAGATGNPSVINAFTNDTLNGFPIVAADINATIVTPATNAGVVFNTSTGLVSVAPGTPAGIYPITYRICEKLNPTNCDNAIIAVVVGAAPIVASNDNPAPVSSIGGATVPSVLLNDSLSGIVPSVGPTGTVTLTQTVADPSGSLTLNPDGTVSVADGTPGGTYHLTYQICERLNPTNCTTAIATVIVTPGKGSLAGVIFEDTNSNGTYDVGETVQGGYTVELLRNGVVAATTTSNPDGSYSFADIEPGSGYTIAATSPTGGVLAGKGSFTIGAGQNVTDVNLPIDPSGIVYDSITRLPVSGAVLRLTTIAGVPLPDVCLASPDQQGQTTTANGAYRFDVVPGASAECPIGETEYRLSVTSPSGYQPGTALTIPGQVGALNTSTCPVDVTAGGSCQVQTQPGAPAVGAATTYFVSFVIALGSPDVVHNHIPLDPLPTIPATGLTVEKTASARVARRGDIIAYQITVRNSNLSAAGPFDLVDRLPQGFGYVTGSAEVAGLAQEPTLAGQKLTFDAIVVPASGTIVIKVNVRVATNVTPGDHVNEAQAINPVTGAPVSGTGRATVRIEIEHVFDCGDVIGKVFDDRNRSGYQDEGEPGLPGVRVATAKGVLITTDKHGRFSVPCAELPDQDIGSNFILKVDTRTLPTGYRMTTENPRTIRLTAGKVTKLNFGAAISRVVRIDLTASAFEWEGSRPLASLEDGIDVLVGKLRESPSVLRLTYYDKSGDGDLASARMKAVEDLVQKKWRSFGNSRLAIETRVVTSK